MKKTTPPQPPAPPARFAGLDGLRAIAVLTVMLFHLSPGFVPGGYLGVDVFFVISGFLITALLLREHDKAGTIHLLNFWRRRARRLLPALGVLLLVCCTGALVVGGDVLVDLGKQVLGATTFSSNWLAIVGERSYFTESTPELLRNLWSLAVEEQFYLLWPLLILLLLLIPRRFVRLTVVGTLAVGSALAMAIIYVPGGDATRVYYGTDTHSFGLAIGAVLAIASRTWSAWPLAWPRWLRITLPSVGLAAVVGLLALSLTMPADAALVYRGGLAAVAVLTAIAIAGATMPGSLLGRGLDVQPLRWIGERSYGLYLWHWPVFVLVVSLLPTWQRDTAGGWALGGIAFAVTAVAAALSYRFVEQPIRKNGFRATFRSWLGGWQVSTPRLVTGTLAVTLAVSLGAASAVAIATDPGKSDAQIIVEAGQAAITPKPPRQQDPQPTKAAPAAPAVLPGGDQISAVGDSVMLASAPELQVAFPGIQIDAVVSRQLADAPAIVGTMVQQGTLRPTLLLGLGTNGPIDQRALDEVRAIVGQKHQIVVVNVQAPRGWTAGVNEKLTIFAQQYRNVELANWHDAIAPNIATLARDQIHPGSVGGRIYAGAVRDALQRLAELPPVLTANEYGLAPHPL